MHEIARMNDKGPPVFCQGWPTFLFSSLRICFDELPVAIMIGWRSQNKERVDVLLAESPCPERTDVFGFFGSLCLFRPAARAQDSSDADRQALCQEVHQTLPVRLCKRLGSDHLI